MGYKVLYVEDNPGDQILVEQMLAECQMHENELITCETLDEGLAVIKNQSLDIILLDLNLPDSSGLETVKSVCRTGNNAPVIIFTGQDDIKMGIESLNLGAQDFLVKGELTPAALLKAFIFARERKTNQLELEKLSVIAEKTDDHIIVTDVDGNIEFANRAFLEFSGYTKDEIMGKTPRILKSGKHSREFYQRLWEDLLEGKTSSIEIINKTKSGTIYYDDKTITPIRNKSGRITHFISISRDRTVRAQYEEQLEHSEAEYRKLSLQLQGANRLLELLMDVVTHDLKNPAGVIEGLSDLLLMENEGSEIAETIRSSAVHLQQTIARAEVLSKTALGESIPMESIMLDDLVQQVCKDFKSQCADAEVSLEIEIPEKFQIKANPIIEEVLVNYLSNALKYARDGKVVTIQAEKDDQGSILRVKDRGSLVALDHRQDIFKRNLQLNRKNSKGRGLGLAIVERIAAAHQGRAWVEANPPQGNSFCLWIPDPITE